jgi:hypothetical protein
MTGDALLWSGAATSESGPVALGLPRIVPPVAGLPVCDAFMCASRLCL